MLYWFVVIFVVPVLACDWKHNITIPYQTTSHLTISWNGYCGATPSQYLVSLAHRGTIFHVSKTNSTRMHITDLRACSLYHITICSHDGSCSLPYLAATTCNAPTSLSLKLSETPPLPPSFHLSWVPPLYHEVLDYYRVRCMVGCGETVYWDVVTPSLLVPNVDVRKEYSFHIISMSKYSGYSPASISKNISSSSNSPPLLLTKHRSASNVRGPSASPGSSNPSSPNTGSSLTSSITSSSFIQSSADARLTSSTTSNSLSKRGVAANSTTITTTTTSTTTTTTTSTTSGATTYAPPMGELTKVKLYIGMCGNESSLSAEKFAEVMSDTLRIPRNHVSDVKIIFVTDDESEYYSNVTFVLSATISYVTPPSNQATEVVNALNNSSSLVVTYFTNRSLEIIFVNATFESANHFIASTSSSSTSTAFPSSSDSPASSTTSQELQANKSFIEQYFLIFVIAAPCFVVVVIVAAIVLTVFWRNKSVTENLRQWDFYRRYSSISLADIT